MKSAVAGVAFLFAVGCTERDTTTLRATAEPASTDAAVGDAALLDASSLDSASVDATQDTGNDACVPGEEWQARVVVTHVRDPIPMQGSLELVVPRLGKRVVVYGNCGITGGGCGECAKPVRDGITCDLDSSHARVDVGIDEVGPTFVDVHQRGDAIVADWTWGGFENTDPPTHETKVLVRLPCAVKVRFVR